MLVAEPRKHDGIYQSTCKHCGLKITRNGYVGVWRHVAFKEWDAFTYEQYQDACDNADRCNWSQLQPTKGAENDTRKE